MKLSVLAIICLPLFTFGQETGIMGRILDRQGAVVSNYPISATQKDGKEVLANTDKRGEYKLSLRNGEYTLTIGRNNFGFCLIQIKGYVVSDPIDLMSLDIVLKDSVASHSREKCKTKIIKF